MTNTKDQTEKQEALTSILEDVEIAMDNCDALRQGIDDAAKSWNWDEVSDLYEKSQYIEQEALGLVDKYGEFVDGGSFKGKVIVLALANLDVAGDALVTAKGYMEQHADTDATQLKHAVLAAKADAHLAVAEQASRQAMENFAVALGSLEDLK